MTELGLSRHGIPPAHLQAPGIEHTCSQWQYAHNSTLKNHHLEGRIEVCQLMISSFYWLDRGEEPDPMRKLFKDNRNPGDGAFMLTGWMARRVLPCIVWLNDSIVIQLLILLITFHLSWTGDWVRIAEPMNMALGIMWHFSMPDPEICDPQELLEPVITYVPLYSFFDVHVKF